MIGLYFESTHGFLICSDCGVALSSKTAAAHVRTNHVACRSSVSDEVLANTCRDCGIVGALPLIKSKVPAITGLFLHPRALSCSQSGCDKIYGTLGSMKKHHYQAHAGVPTPSSWSTVFAQRLDNSLTNSFFEVDLPPSQSPPSTTAWLDVIESAIQFSVNADPLVVQDPRQLNSWLRAVGWASHVKSFNAEFLRMLVVAPAKDEFPGLKEGVIHKFTADVELIRQTPLLALQKLNTEDPLKTYALCLFRLHSI